MTTEQKEKLIAFFEAVIKRLPDDVEVMDYAVRIIYKNGPIGCPVFLDIRELEKNDLTVIDRIAEVRLDNSLIDMDKLQKKGESDGV